jgi:hypothetical protein
MLTPTLLSIIGILLVLIGSLQYAHELAMSELLAYYAPPPRLPTIHAILAPDPLTEEPFPLVVPLNACWGSLEELAPTRTFRPHEPFLVPLAGPQTTITPQRTVVSW